MLEEANMWSGRGEYDDVAGAAQAVIARNAAHREEQAAAVELDDRPGPQRDYLALSHQRRHDFIA